MSNLQAAMGCAQIERADELINKKRQVFDWYKSFLAGVPCKMNPEPNYAKNSYWMPTAIFDDTIDVDREKLFSFMKENNIDTRPFFYPLSSLPMFEAIIDNRVSYDIYRRGINLPSHPDINKVDVQKVSDVIKKFVGSKGI
jgi:perosamine synthetase